MAKATKITPEPIPFINLELNEEEATFLLDVMRAIGGSMDTRRRYGAEITRALRDADVVTTGFGTPHDVDPHRSSIYFV